jgi:hypothetical protein
MDLLLKLKTALLFQESKKDHLFYYFEKAAHVYQ